MQGVSNLGIQCILGLFQLPTDITKLLIVRSKLSKIFLCIRILVFPSCIVNFSEVTILYSFRMLVFFDFRVSS